MVMSPSVNSGGPGPSSDPDDNGCLTVGPSPKFGGQAGIGPDALGAGLSARLPCQAANLSSDSQPDLHMLNVVVRDMAATLEFCRRPGIAVLASGDAVGGHVQLKMPDIAAPAAPRPPD
jgi:hypothetical protein